MFYMFLVLLPLSDSKCDWPSIDGLNLSFDDFLKLHWEKQPVVLTGMIGAWPAFADENWQPQKFIDKYGHHTFDSSHISGNNRNGLVGQAYTDGISLVEFFNTSRKQPTSWFLQPGAPLVQELFQKGDFFIPSGLKGIHRDGPYLSIGRRKQMNPFHDHDHNWFAQVQGSKRWYAVAPQVFQNLQFNLQEVDVCKSKRLQSFKRCDLQPGQVVYLPSNFVHGTCVLTDHTIGVAFIGSSATSTVKLKSGMGADLSLDVKLGRANTKNLKVQSSARDDLLTLAAGSGHTRLVKSLFKDGLNTSTKIQAMSIAAANGHQGVLDYLSKKVGLHVQTEEGMSMLHLAANDGHLPVVKWLEGRGMDANHKYSFSPIYAAAGGGHIPVLKHLIAGRADIRTKDADGMTILHMAAHFNYLYVIRFLNEEMGVELGEDLLAWTRREKLLGASRFISKQMAKNKGKLTSVEL